MSEHSCCHGTGGTANGNRHTRRATALIKWIVPTAVLALLPKCPMCLAAYIALATGFGISFAAATWIRTGFLAASLCTLIYLSIRAVIRLRSPIRKSIN